MVQRMLQEMRKTTLKDSSGSGTDRATEIFQSLFDQAVSQQAAKQGKGLGIAAMLEKQLSPQVHSQPADNHQGRIHL